MNKFLLGLFLGFFTLNAVESPKRMKRLRIAKNLGYPSWEAFENAIKLDKHN